MPICVHGHFYQPPREDPWTGRIPEQPGAAPFHDWNEKVHAEAYRANAFVRVPTVDGEIVANNFERISFNVGPTLLRWMEESDPETYAAILQADKESAQRLGHGNALAQAFHHTILPLSPVRDVRTQVRWGVADFKHRFGREPRGMWLPETAANEDVLEVLIEEGITFTILAPNQAAVWTDDEQVWHAPPVDTRAPYRWNHRDRSGRSLTIFFYDGELSRQIAFGGAATDAEAFLHLFAERLVEDHMLVHAATDGETYGHHKKFTDLGLGYALFVEAEKRSLDITNYAAFLEANPPIREVIIIGGEGSSWSCAHGVGRWARDCGCSTGGEPGWNQRWRAPLRSALDVVRDVADEAFDRLGREFLGDPWAARDDYVQVVIGAQTADDFVTERAARPLDDEGRETARKLLRLQEMAMSMYTSCGWFFNDIGGIETVQVLAYARATMELLRELDQPAPQQAFLDLLATAESNDPDVGTGADVYLGITPPSLD